MKKIAMPYRSAQLFLVFVALIGLAALALPANALQIQEVVSPGGIRAWLEGKKREAKLSFSTSCCCPRILAGVKKVVG